MTDIPSVEPVAIAKEEAVKIEFVTLATEEQGHKVTLKETAEAQGQVEMFIGGSEFASIAKELGLIQPPRPLTHEVYLNLLDGLEVDFGRLEIYGLKDNAFLAKLFFSKKGQPEEMEIRPSDGLALALHHHLPIFLNRRLLKGTLSARDRETLEDLVKTVKF